MAKKNKSIEAKEKHFEGKRRLVVGAGGRIFEGFVAKKFPKRVVVEFDRIIYVKKYERFTKTKTRIHARLPEGIDANMGDYIRVRECRPLSKIIHFIVTDIVRKRHGEKK